MNALWVWIQGAWKAIVAAVAPLLVALVGDLLEVVEAQVPALITAAVTALLVYLVPNREPSEVAADVPVDSGQANPGTILYVALIVLVIVVILSVIGLI